AGVIVLGRRDQRLLRLGGRGGLFLLAGDEAQHQRSGKHHAHRVLHGSSPSIGLVTAVGMGQAPARDSRASRSASSTVAGTKPDTSPPSRAISRTSEEEMKLCCSDGVRNRVSTSGIRWRFMLAIWNSYSKSDTARRPRSSTPPWQARTKWASSVSKPTTSTLSWCFSASTASDTRS